MTTVLLVRHGQNDWVDKKRLAGRQPGVHLNDNGREQAAALAERLQHLSIRAIYSSPLERCMETAAFVSSPHQLDVQPVDELIEVDYGKWEGKKIKKLARKKGWYAVQHYPSRFVFPDGEAFSAVQKRSVDIVEALAKKHGQETIVLVSHADIIKLVITHYLGIHLDLFQRMAILPASVSMVAVGDNGGVRVIRVNDNGRIEIPETKKKLKPAAEDQPEAESEQGKFESQEEPATQV